MIFRGPRASCCLQSTRPLFPISPVSMEEIQKNPFPVAMDFPPYFRCPISMEVMEDPVTISTGLTFERTNIEKWFFTYNKKTCPATMQRIVNFDITPNYTLKRLILSWKTRESCSSSQTPPPPPQPMVEYDEVVALLQNIESSPFKASSLRKLRLRMAVDDAVGAKSIFVRANGFEVLIGIVIQVVSDGSDFANFEACEEALGVLSQFPFSRTEKPFDQLLSKPESMKSMAVVLQRGSTEGRFYAMEMLRKMTKNSYDWNLLTKHQAIDMLKSILELVSDEMCKKASSTALEVLIEIMESSKKSRIRSIEAGAVCFIIDLLPDSNRSKCEKMLHILKLLSECAEGRSAMTEHPMGIAAVTKKMTNVSNLATKSGVKILWLICNYHRSERVLEEMMGCGAVKKLLALLHVDGRSSTKEKAMKIMKLHGSFWRRFPCFPYEFRDYLKLVNQ